MSALGISCLAGAQESAPPEERKLTIEFSKTIEMEKRLGGCKANLELEYWQKGDVAEVESTLTNAECGPSSGDYTIRIRYRDDDGEVTTDDHPERWERSDASPVVRAVRYPIGSDVDLISVRSRGLSCTCADESTAPGPENPD